ncbi:DNA-binding transcriptional regulator YhcF, GntR family [Sinosporangium album]|uniref:DNA-binding transcriptional regulator YhcF, GntR family n=2 Tax=Sinosporangium album TaxID=504805 RepID=A0A1G7ZEY4_9ACTN|nr:DNA-binding transcriptional regulator YhcF, GntR family [Sinosporangium album]
MRLSIDLSSPLPLFDQIAEGLRRELSLGTLQPGDHLPPARDLAASLGVNLHTVLRAYALLRDEGVVEVRRGRGTVVVFRPRVGDDPRLTRAVNAVVAEARRVGLTADQLVGYGRICD